MIHQQQISLRTAGHGDMHNLTEDLHQIVRRSRVRTGVAHVFCIGSTAAVGVIEFEPQPGRTTFRILLPLT